MERVEKNAYKLFDPYLQQISRELTIKKLVVAEQLIAFREVFDGFRLKLYEAEPFLGLYKEIIYSGSYSNNIKIKAPDEFDMMLCMKLPAELNVQILNSIYPAYVQLKTCGVEALKRKQNWDKYKCIEKWLDSKNFVLQNKLRAWLEGIIQKVLNQLDSILVCGENQYLLKLSKSNPAFTLHVQSLTNRSIIFDVDLVPNFIFAIPTWPPIVKQKLVKKYKSKEWFVIAKPIYDSNDDRHKCWRVVLSKQESEILHSNNNMKSTIRFLKQIRDVYKIPYLKSYFINMIFIWEADKQDPGFWNNRLSFLFMHMLHEVQRFIADERIPYFWDNRLNLLEKPSHHQLNDCVIKINNIFKIIDKNYPGNPGIIAQILDVDLVPVSSTFSQLSMQPSSSEEENIEAGCSQAQAGTSSNTSRLFILGLAAAGLFGMYSLLKKKK